MPPFPKSQQLHKKEKALDFTHEGQASKRKKALIKERKPLKKVSKKQVKELKKRRKVKKKLMKGYCQLCGERPDFRGLQLHHLEKLSQGGETVEPNLVIICGKCHDLQHHIVDK